MGTGRAAASDPSAWHLVLRLLDTLGEAVSSMYRVRGMVGGNYLPEPGALKDSEAGSEEFQHNVVPKDHFQGDAESPSKYCVQQEGVDVLVQRRPVVDVVVEEKACSARTAVSPHFHPEDSSLL